MKSSAGLSSLCLGGELLPQLKGFKYLGVLFTSEGKMVQQMDRWFGVLSVVLLASHQTVVVKSTRTRTKSHYLAEEEIYLLLLEIRSSRV